VGTELYGVGIHDGISWTVLNTGNSPLPDNTVHGITHDHRGWVWISTALGLACITDSGWRIYDNTPGSHMGFELFGPNVRQVVVRPDDLVCAVTMNGGLVYITEEEFLNYTTYNSTIPDNSANAIALDSNGDRWLASPAAGLIRHAGPQEGGPWFNFTAQNSGFPNNTLTSIVIDGLDTKFAGTETHGIIRYPANGNWSVLNMANSGLPDDWVRCLFLDQDGVLWAGTNTGGLARFDPLMAAGTADVTPAIRAYPMPFQALLHVHWPPNVWGGEWRLLDMLGRAHAGGRILYGEQPASLDLSTVAPGAYVLHGWFGNDRSAQKVVKVEAGLR
jgi:ligand-binding sensor domain-containing protein